MTTTEQQPQDLADARLLLISERYGDVLTTIERFLDTVVDPGQRVEGLLIRLLCLIRVGRSAELTSALDAAFEAHRAAATLNSTGHVNALAAMVSHRLGSLDRCATHLVRASRALAKVDLTNCATAWAWQDLAMAYSEAGFHGHALAAAGNARQVASSIGLRDRHFAAPWIQLRLAVSLDHRGDSDGCQRVLRDIGADLDHRGRLGDLDQMRPSCLRAYGYALARLAAGEASGGRPTDRAARLTQARQLLDRPADSGRDSHMRLLGLVCLDLAEGSPSEALRRLDTAGPGDDCLDPAEVLRLRALAHLAAGDAHSALLADRHAFRIASTQVDRIRELFVEAVGSRLDSEDLRRTVAGYGTGHSTDQLTGLPGRDYLEQHLSDLLARGERPLLAICDLDGFVAVNEEHGRSSGDLVLQRFAGILNRVMRRGDVIARVGGDEFAVVLPAVARPLAKEIGRRIVSAVAQEDWGGLVPGARLGVTLGWAGVADDQAFESAAEAMMAASTAVVRAKRLSR